MSFPTGSTLWESISALFGWRPKVEDGGQEPSMVVEVERSRLPSIIVGNDLDLDAPYHTFMDWLFGDGGPGNAPPSGEGGLLPVPDWMKAPITIPSLDDIWDSFNLASVAVCGLAILFLVLFISRNVTHR